MITVEQLESEIEQAFELKDKVAAYKRELSELNEELERKQLRIMSMLEDLERDSYHSKHGIFSYKYLYSYKVPKDSLNREMFFNYLKTKGVFEQLITVNSQTLNAWAPAEMRAQGDDFIIPGIEKGEPYPKFTMRRS